MFSSPSSDKRIRIINTILLSVAVVLLIGFGVLLFFDNKTEQQNITQNIEVARQDEDEHRKEIIESRNEAMELEKKKESDSFYQKLEDGFDVKILVIGDNIGAGEGASDTSKAWTELLVSQIKKTYDVDVYVKNVSMSGNSSYAGYVRTMALSDRVQYDLAIICYGQNDENKKFQMYYESIIHAIRSKYNKCSIISVLESSQKKYTDKIKVIQNLAEHYGIPVADTIKPFTDGIKGKYDTLTDDGVNPNDKGHQIYASVIADVIDEEVDNGTGYDSTEIEPVNTGVNNFDTLEAINARDFTQNGNSYVYNIDSPIKGIIGIDYKYISGKNSCKIFIDGKEYKAPEAEPKNDTLQLRILVLSEQQIEALSSIEVRFDTTEESDGFKGVCFSSQSEK